VLKVSEDEILVHIKSGAAILTQLGDFRKIPKNLNIQTLKDVPVDLAIHADSKYTAHGWARYDDGETQDLTAYTEFQINAKGANPFLGTGYLDIDITTPVDKSTTAPSINQNIGSIVIYNSGLFSLGKSSKATIVFNNGDSTQVIAEYHKDQNLARFIMKTETGISMREIKSIKITAK